MTMQTIPRRLATNGKVFRCPGIRIPPIQGENGLYIKNDYGKNDFTEVFHAKVEKNAVPAAVSHPVI